MNSAYALAEYQQCREHFPKALFILGGLSMVAGAVFGLFGVIWVAAMIPIHAGSIGAGMFDEEYHKKYLRFMLTLPLERRRMFQIKLFSAAVGLVLISVVQAAAAVLGLGLHPGGVTDLIMLCQRMPGQFLQLILACAASAIYIFAAGAVANGMCASTRSANIARWFMMIPAVPLVALWVRGSSDFSRISNISFIFAVAALPLLWGSWKLFQIRNPFFEEPARWRRVGFAAAGVATLIFAGGAAMLHIPTQEAQTAQQYVRSFSIAPDRSKVGVNYAPDGWRVFSSDGQQLAQGTGQLSANPWNPSDHAATVLSVDPETTSMVFIVDLNTGAKRMLDLTAGDQPFWDPSGRRVIRQGGRFTSAHLAIWDSQADKVALHAVSPPGQFRPARDALYARAYSGQAKVARFEYESAQLQTFDVPEQTEPCVFNPGLYLGIRRSLRDNQVHEAVYSIELPSMRERVLLEAPALPPTPAATALEEMGRGSSILQLRGSRLLYVLHPQQTLLLDYAGSTIRHWAVPETLKHSNYYISPDGSQTVALSGKSRHLHLLQLDTSSPTLTILREFESPVIPRQVQWLDNNRLLLLNYEPGQADTDAEADQLPRNLSVFNRTTWTLEPFVPVQ